ncbi:hypothetical protein [Paracoccus simplex]|uniref:Uncharacterized protein n=1 Tax=Paracoccus simplex TaxID=2086346 RepID=A0ABV7S4V3_9RHOB
MTVKPNNAPFDRSQSRHRGIVGQYLTRDPRPAETPAMERLRCAFAAARNALPYAERAPGGDLDRTLRIPMPAARMVTLDIGADHLPAFEAPASNQPSEAMTLAESLLTYARTLQAGAHLLIEPKGRVIETGTGVPALQVVPMGLEVVRPAPFEVVLDPDGDDDPENPGTAPLTPLGSVLVGDRSNGLMI